MAVEVYTSDGRTHQFYGVDRFMTEESYNNLEVVARDGQIIAAFNGKAWTGAVIEDDD